MDLMVNGKKITVEKNLTVSELLSYLKVKMPEMVSVELNDKIIKRNKYPEIQLKNGDRVEFLYFMGGGNGI